MGEWVEGFLRVSGGSIGLLGGGVETGVSSGVCSVASSPFSNLWAVVRGEETGLSDARYVVANMLSRSDSCGRSIDDFQRWFS